MVQKLFDFRMISHRWQKDELHLLLAIHWPVRRCRLSELLPNFHALFRSQLHPWSLDESVIGFPIQLVEPECFPSYWLVYRKKQGCSWFGLSRNTVQLRLVSGSFENIWIARQFDLQKSRTAKTPSKNSEPGNPWL